MEYYQDKRNRQQITPWKKAEIVSKRVVFTVHCFMCTDTKYVDKFDDVTLTMKQVNCPVCTGERK